VSIVDLVAAQWFPEATRQTEQSRSPRHVEPVESSVLVGRGDECGYSQSHADSRQRELRCALCQEADDRRNRGDRRENSAPGSDRHRGAGRGDLLNLEPGSGPVPPLAVWRRGGTELRGCRSAVEVPDVAAVGRVLEVEPVVGLLQRALVVLARGHLLVVVTAELVHVPDRQPRVR